MLRRLSFGFFAPALFAQVPAPAPTPVPPSDLATIDGLLKALYGTLSGPKGQARDVPRFKNFFAPGARITSGRPRRDGRPSLVVMDLDDFATKSLAWMEANGFYEKELGRKVEQWGRVAQAWSAYASGSTPDLTHPTARGINALTLVNDGQRWWIAGLAMDEEAPGKPLPDLSR